MWEAETPSPSAVFGASAHPPQAPIWLDPSGCPPGRVFILWIALHFPGVLLHLLFDDVRNPAVPACRLDREDIEAPEQYGSSVLSRGHSLDFVKVFHKIILSCLVDSRPLRPASVFSPYGLVHDSSHRRDLRAPACRALAHAGRAAAGTPHRIVREWTLAP